MSKAYPIPDFTEEPQSMVEAMRAMKAALLSLTGQTRTSSLGAPLVFLTIRPPEPSAEDVKAGDFWINNATRELYFFDGSGWKKCL